MAALTVGALIGAALLVIYGAGGYVRYEGTHSLEFGPRKGEPPEKTPPASEPAPAPPPPASTPPAEPPKNPWEASVREAEQ
jgi:hypothetical protein